MRRFIGAAVAALLLTAMWPSFSAAATTTDVWFVHAEMYGYDIAPDIYLDGNLVLPAQPFGQFSVLAGVDDTDNHDVVACYPNPNPPATIIPNGCPSGYYASGSFAAGTFPVMWMVLGDNGDGQSIYPVNPPRLCPPQGSGAMISFNAAWTSVDVAVDNGTPGTLTVGASRTQELAAGNHTVTVDEAGTQMNWLSDVPVPVLDQQVALAVVAAGSTQQGFQAQIVQQSFPLPGCQVATTTTTTTTTTSTAPATTTTTAAATAATTAATASAVTGAASYAG